MSNKKSNSHHISDTTPFSNTFNNTLFSNEVSSIRRTRKKGFAPFSNFAVEKIGYFRVQNYNLAHLLSRLSFKPSEALKGLS